MFLDLSPTWHCQMNDVTQLLIRIENGDVRATNDLFPLVYEELKHLAAAKIKKESDDQKLEATGLVHEAYLRLVDSENEQWSGRAHFFAAAAEAMRRILIDQARSRKSLKRGGLERTLSLDTIGPLTDEKADELISLNDALDQLQQADSQKAELVKLKFFVGMTTQQAAEILNISLRTAERNWAFARAWLYQKMSDFHDETIEN